MLYLLRKLISTVVVMFIVATIIFLLLRIAPGDPAAIIAGDAATEEQIRAIRAQLGLDQSIFAQFYTWLTQILRGDFGVSIFSDEPVSRLIMQRLEPTLSLAFTTITFSVIISLVLGVLAAWRAGTTVDKVLMAMSVAGFSTPVFVAGYVLIYFISVQFRWLPAQGYQPIANGVGVWLSYLVLPSIALGFSYIALLSRMTRTAVLEVLGEDYIRTAHSKGAAAPRVMVIHALRNASVPIVTVIGIGISMLLSGVAVTETVFNIPGLGRLVVDAVLKRDYPIIQCLILVFSSTYVLINLLVDLSYTFLDPRIRC